MTDELIYYIVDNSTGNYWTGEGWAATKDLATKMTSQRAHQDMLLLRRNGMNVGLQK